MSLLFTRQQILEGLLLDVADCLAFEQAEVTPESQFFSSLAGESLELLDLSFRIQKRFGIRTRFKDFLEGWEFDPNGQVSQQTVDRLENSFPHIDWSGRLAAVSVKNPRDFVTVDLIADLVFHSQSQNDSVTLKEAS
jgi:acyl carrier protein